MPSPTPRIIALIVGALLILALVGFGVRSCDKRRSAAAQARMDNAQADAKAESAKEAVDAVARSGEAAAASEDLSRTNEKDIRHAKGADTAVDPDVGNAGMRALCRRATYRDSEQCRLFKPDS